MPFSWNSPLRLPLLRFDRNLHPFTTELIPRALRASVSNFLALGSIGRLAVYVSMDIRGALAWSVRLAKGDLG